VFPPNSPGGPGNPGGDGTPGNHHPGADPRSSATGARVSRRRALQIGGAVGLTGLLAACGSGSGGAGSGQDAGTGPGSDSGTGPGTSSVTGDDAEARLAGMLDQAPRCPMTREETQGPYWFDVDDIRSDVREDRRGVPMRLALRVQDTAQCTADDPSAGAVENAVVEIWQCDAMGVYSGFRKGFGSGPPHGAPQGSAPESDGSYSVGDTESVPSGDATYLREAQVTDADGIAEFTSIYPGWYSGRAVHVHIKVHRDKKTVLTTQLFFDDDLTDTIHSSNEPYSLRGQRDTRNSADAIYDPTGLTVTQRTDGGVLAALNLGIET